MTSTSFLASFARSCALASVAVPLVAVAFAQSAERPKFEVASVKLFAGRSPMAVRPMPGGHLAATAPVKLLIMYAYGFQYSEIVGGPDWINADSYEIDAKAANNADRARVMVMLQSLLEDRFQMRVHREARETAAYALVVDKNGPTLAATKQAECPTAEVAGPPCGQMKILRSPTAVRMEGDRTPISELVRVLAVAARRPVLDRTALSGLYDIRLQFVDEPPGAPLSDSSGLSVFAALQEQLGLKLESTKGPAEFLIIDHVERPTAN
jgi:uncharacterized protein (TIGR03435 family)